MTGEVALGKSSIVYRAQRRATGRTVAVKVFVESELDDWARRRFIEGTQRADELTSPAFIKIIDYFLEESPEFLVSEFIEGEPLSKLPAAIPSGLPLTKVKSILLDLMRAIEEAHDRGWGRGRDLSFRLPHRRVGSPPAFALRFFQHATGAGAGYGKLPRGPRVPCLHDSGAILRPGIHQTYRPVLSRQPLPRSFSGHSYPARGETLRPRGQTGLVRGARVGEG